MKYKYLPLLGILLLPSCANYNDNFYLEISSSKGSDFYYNDENNLNVEIYDNCTIYFNIPSDIKVTEQNSQDLLSFKYDESKINLSFNNYYSNKILYNFQSKGLFNGELFSVEFNNKTYDYKVNSLKPSGYNKLDEYTLGSSYKEFKEMLNSISFYTYGDDYPGIDSYHDSSYWGRSFNYNINDNNEYSLDYLKYLKDDCYYPSKFDFAKPNIMYSSFEMKFDDKCSIEKNSLKHTMLGYSVSIGVIDPGCTNPTNPLRSMSFEATPLNYKSKYKYANEFNDKKLNNHYYLLSKEYEELFLDYKSNNLDIKLINYEDDSIIGFFEDETYLYTLSCSYKR